MQAPLRVLEGAKCGHAATKDLNFACESYILHDLMHHARLKSELLLGCSSDVHDAPPLLQEARMEDGNRFRAATVQVPGHVPAARTNRADVRRLPVGLRVQL